LRAVASDGVALGASGGSSSSSAAALALATAVPGADATVVRASGAERTAGAVVADAGLGASRSRAKAAKIAAATTPSITPSARRESLVTVRRRSSSVPMRVGDPGEVSAAASGRSGASEGTGASERSDEASAASVSPRAAQRAAASSFADPCRW
jgi:hypothetical protein